VPDGGLSFRFVPDEQTSRLSFTASWDGTPILDQPARPSLEGSTLEIPARLATPGLHILRVDRAGFVDPPELHDQHDNRFSEISYAVGSPPYLQRGCYRRALHRHAGGARGHWTRRAENGGLPVEAAFGGRGRRPRKRQQTIVRGREQLCSPALLVGGGPQLGRGLLAPRGAA
jgi:hypothetical protein